MELAKNYFKQISDIIVEARNRAEIAINSELVLLYWNIGKVIKTEILIGDKPEYGKSVIESLSRELVAEYGKGYSKSNLFNMVKLYEVYSDEQIFHSLRGKLSWTHIKRLIYIDDPMQRQFYLDLTINERWSSRVLIDRINGMLYERTLISKKPEETIANDLMLLSEKKVMNLFCVTLMCLTFLT